MKANDLITSHDDLVCRSRQAPAHEVVRRRRAQRFPRPLPGCDAVGLAGDGLGVVVAGVWLAGAAGVSLVDGVAAGVGSAAGVLVCAGVLPVLGTPAVACCVTTATAAGVTVT